MKQRYDSYKPSGIGWIGDIPSHWNNCTLKQASSSIRNGYVGPTKDILVDDGIPYFQSLHVKDGKLLFDRGEYYVTKKWADKHPKIYKDDIVIVQTGDIGQVAIVPAEYDGCNCHALIIVVSDKQKINPLFLLYYLRSSIGKELMLLTKTGATLPHLNSGSICNTQLILPPLSEQEAIAAWLDEKCEEIDAAIAKVDREIELIDELKQSEISRIVTRGLDPDAPLRPSGIDWIGNIPSHWTKCRFKNFMYLKTNPSCSQVKVGLENLESGSGKFIESDTEFEGNGVEFCHNDILYGKLRPYLRKVWLAEFSGNAVGDFFVFGNYSNSAASYLKYLFLSDGFTKQADGSTFGAKMPRVSSEFILTLPFYLPPLSEQQAIADYLDKKCSEIDKLKAKLSKKRETLTELRQSIISEVVTGKRKVI